MKSVADELRWERSQREAELTPSERVALVLRLGRQAIARYAAAHGVSEREAKVTLQRNHQVGRRPCACIDGLLRDQLRAGTG